MFGLLPKRLRPGLTAIGVGADGVCLAQVLREGGHPPRLLAWDFRPLESAAGFGPALAGLARDHDLKRARCVTVLDDADYKLLLTEAPEVAADELKAAVRWRIKDLIDFHINDAAIDVFDLPSEAGEARAREMYVVAARNQTIQQRVDQMDAAGVNLEIIDIPELAQRNIATLLPQDVDGVLLLSLHAHHGLITITRQGQIYLSRGLAVGVEEMLGASDMYGYFDQTVLEIQRSFDYFESHFRQTPVRHLALAPLARPVPGLVEHIESSLNLTVTPLNVAQLLDGAEELPEPWQARCLPTLGAALRQEVKAL